VTADPENLRFYFDESALGIGKTLCIARKDAIHVGHRLIPECPYGVLDPDWIPAVAARGLIVIGRDKHIRSRPEEYRQLREAGLRVFRIGGKRDESTWEWLKRIVRHWDAMEDIIANRGPGPWFYAINQNGLVERSIPDVEAERKEPLPGMRPTTLPRDKQDSLF
jgi:hypothetical protein